MSAALDRCRATPPAGEASGPCPRHPAEPLVFVEIAGIDLTAGEAPVTARGWTCRKCFNARSVRFARGPELT